jgi:hypothetical protein
MQGLCNLLYHEEEREMNPFCQTEGIGLIFGVRWLGDYWRALGRKCQRVEIKTRRPSDGLLGIKMKLL